jgi:hypothetical protein
MLRVAAVSVFEAGEYHRHRSTFQYGQEHQYPGGFRSMDDEGQER